MYGIKKVKNGQGPTKGCRAIEEKGIDRMGVMITL
jgi:hypothetical protein